MERRMRLTKCMQGLRHTIDRAMPRDARWLQIGSLASLLVYGVAVLDLEVRPAAASVVISICLIAQWLGTRLAGLPAFDPKSALISGLSLSLLARTADPVWLVVAPALTIGSKFVLRVDGRHVFNPTNFGLAVAMLASDRVWVSPGQWGSVAITAFAAICLGSLVVRRAERSDVTWAFLAAWLGLLFGRAWWLGDPIAIPLHQTVNGALLIFAFFMISDPKTTPDSRWGRILFACLVASVAYVLRFVYFDSNALIWALAGCSPLVPVFNRLLAGRRYEWPGRAPVRLSPTPPPTPHVSGAERCWPSEGLSARALRDDRSAQWPGPQRRAGGGRQPKSEQPLPSLGGQAPRGATWLSEATREGAPSAVSPTNEPVTRQEKAMRPTIKIAVLLVLAMLGTTTAHGFCGFYVAKADTDLFNQASKVAIVRDGDRTVLTMANDYQGEAEEFAVVIPVPQPLEEGQIHVTDLAILDHLDAYTAPRLVEYFDEDPCRVVMYEDMVLPQSAVGASNAAAKRARALGVTIEAEYTVGEYDILILSAKESQGLETWLVQEGYRIPGGASEVLGSYLKQGMYFFVAKVNLEEQAKLGYTYLRPLQVAYEDPRFMLPIRLGTVNADGPQELFVFTLTRKGRVETTNYRTVKLPTGNEIPVYVEGEFGDFYRAMFDRQVEQHDMRAVFLEYAWDMAWCDPCAADPLTPEELRELGVFWLGGGPSPESRRPQRRSAPQQAQDVFVTRLHVRYDAEHFPEDLVFQQTGDRTNFQGRYVLRHPWEGEAACEAAERYFDELPDVLDGRAQQLASLTGWDINDIRDRMSIPEPAPTEPWWKRIWN